jgi:hypothetical protein
MMIKSPLLSVIHGPKYGRAINCSTVYLFAVKLISMLSRNRLGPAEPF